MEKNHNKYKFVNGYGKIGIVFIYIYILIYVI